MTTARSGFATGLAAAAVEPGTVRVVQVDGRSVCVGHTEDGEWGAIDNVCTHDGGVLGDGELDGEAVECPRHGSLFDLCTGAPKTLPAYVPVETFPVVVEDDIVKLEVD